MRTATTKSICSTSTHFYSKLFPKLHFIDFLSWIISAELLLRNKTAIKYVLLNDVIT